MPIPLKSWLEKATPAETKQLAKLAKSSVKTIQNVALGHRQGSAEFAVRIHAASQAMRTAQGNPVKLIDQASVCPACRKCPHYIACNSKA